MRALSSFDVLSLWERGSALHPLDRGLLALSAALPDVPPARLADWPLGRRNRALVDLYCASFGANLEGWSACAACGEKMEFEMDGRALLKESGEAASEDKTVTVNDRSYRLPTSRDLALASRAADAEAAAVVLLERCRIDDGGTAAWSTHEMEALDEQMMLADPLAEIRLALRCPACGGQAEETLDMVSFVWAQIKARARGLLWEVHALASAYGWTQAEILSLSEARRGFYLEMVRG